MFILGWAVLYFSIVASSEVNPDNCAQLTQKSLIIILGQAFNPRYMSVILPEAGDNSKSGYKRSSNEISFYAEDDILITDDKPAWETNSLNPFFRTTIPGSRNIRQDHSVKKRKTQSRTKLFKVRPWECSSIIHWLDLGDDYFPRYVRSVECIEKRCWYGHFYCKAKSFTIKVLRRKNTCVHVNRLTITTPDMPDNDYTELWVWEEVAINFCCDCVMVY